MLLELIVALALTLILYTVFAFSGRNACNIKNNLEVKDAYNGIVDIFMRAKEYCRSNERIGSLTFDLQEDIIKFYDVSKVEHKLIYSYKMPGDIDLTYINSELFSIDIDERGGAKDSCTIEFKDKSGKIYTLTICVGSFMIDVK